MIVRFLNMKVGIQLFIGSKDNGKSKKLVYGTSYATPLALPIGLESSAAKQSWMSGLVTALARPSHLASRGFKRVLVASRRLLKRLLRVLLLV